MKVLENLYKAYRKKAAFFLVYIREAHPVEETLGPGGERRKLRRRQRRVPDINQHKKLADRVLAATDCVKNLKLSVPVLIDDMRGTAEKAYGGWPDRLCIVDIHGRIAYHSARGPWGFVPAHAEAALKQILANGGVLSGFGPLPPPQPTTRPAKAPAPGKPARPDPRPEAARRAKKGG